MRGNALDKKSNYELLEWVYCFHSVIFALRGNMFCNPAETTVKHTFLQLLDICLPRKQFHFRTLLHYIPPKMKIWHTVLFMFLPKGHVWLSPSILIQIAHSHAVFSYFLFLCTIELKWYEVILLLFHYGTGYVLSTSGIWIFPFVGVSVTLYRNVLVWIKVALVALSVSVAGRPWR